MDAGLISSIIGGVTSLTGAFLNFGAQVYSIDHTKLPSPDVNNYIIQAPTAAKKSTFSPELIALLVCVLLLLIVSFFIIKKA